MPTGRRWFLKLETRSSRHLILLPLLKPKANPSFWFQVPWQTVETLVIGTVSYALRDRQRSVREWSKRETESEPRERERERERERIREWEEWAREMSHLSASIRLVINSNYLQLCSAGSGCPWQPPSWSLDHTLLPERFITNEPGVIRWTGWRVRGIRVPLCTGACLRKLWSNQEAVLRLTPVSSLVSHPYTP